MHGAAKMSGSDSWSGKNIRHESEGWWFESRQVETFSVSKTSTISQEHHFVSRKYMLLPAHNILNVNFIAIIYVYTHTHTHTHIYIYIYIYNAASNAGASKSLKWYYYFLDSCLSCLGDGYETDLNMKCTFSFWQPCTVWVNQLVLINEALT